MVAHFRLRSTHPRVGIKRISAGSDLEMVFDEVKIRPCVRWYSVTDQNRRSITKPFNRWHEAIADLDPRGFFIAISI